jgi:hypothetical protein
MAEVHEMSEEEYWQLQEIWAEHRNENTLSKFDPNACQCKACRAYRRESARIAYDRLPSCKRCGKKVRKWKYVIVRRMREKYCPHCNWLHNRIPLEEIPF